MEDNFGNIWFGTFTGLNKYNPTSNQFEVYARNPLPGSMTHSSVFPVYKDRQGTIWLGTYYGGVNYFNPETDIFTVYAANNSRNDCLRILTAETSIHKILLHVHNDQNFFCHDSLSFLRIRICLILRIPQITRHVKPFSPDDPLIKNAFRAFSQKAFSFFQSTIMEISHGSLILLAATTNRPSFV